MSPNYLQQQTSWPSLTNIQLLILIMGLLEFFLFHLLTNTKSFSTLFSWFNSSSNNKHRDSIAFTKVHRDVKGEDKGAISGGDIDVVLRKLGMPVNGGGEGMSLEEIVDLWEEEKPSLEELKQAFDVFDDNGDGFIDAEELQKVLCGLGFSDGVRVENCRRMIGVFDEDGDGRIDFHEFLSFLETSSNNLS